MFLRYYRNQFYIFFRINSFVASAPPVFILKHFGIERSGTSHMKEGNNSNPEHLKLDKCPGRFIWLNLSNPSFISPKLHLIHLAK